MVLSHTEFMGLTDMRAYGYIKSTFGTYQQAPEEITWALSRIRSHARHNNIEIRRILEIGSNSGANLPMLSRLFNVERGTLVSIEPDPPGRKIPMKFDEITRLTSPHEFHHIKGLSDDPDVITQLSELLSGSSLNVLFIDGGHLYHQAKHDFETYVEYVADPGIIVIHDITFMHNIKNKCVGTYWNEIKRYYAWESKYMRRMRGLGGTGILYIGGWCNEIQYQDHGGL